MPSMPMKGHRGNTIGTIPKPMNNRMGQGAGYRYSDTEGFKDMNERMKQPAKGSASIGQDLNMRQKQGGQKIGKPNKK